jgi:hypothetical protein
MQTLVRSLPFLRDGMPDARRQLEVSRKRLASRLRKTLFLKHQEPGHSKLTFPTWNELELRSKFWDIQRHQITDQFSIVLFCIAF